MSTNIEIPSAQTTQRSSLNWAQNYDEIVALYNLHLSSTGPANLDPHSIKQKIYELLSFCKENHIQAEFELEFLTQILNELNSPELPQGPQNITENDKKILVESDKNSTNIMTFRCVYDEYLDFIKATEIIKGDLKDILTIQDFQTRKGEFEKLMLKKPSLQKAAGLRDWMKNSSSHSYDQEIEILQDLILPCKVWDQKVKEYLEKYERYVIDDEVKIEASQIKEMTRGINAIKDEMNMLILKDADLEKKCFIFEWRFQAKLFMSSDGDKGLPQSDIKYWKELLKKAQDSKQKEILESERYKDICKQVVRSQNLREQVKEIEDQEKLLVKLGFNRKEVEAMGKGFRDQESVESILRRLVKCRVLTFEEEIFLQRILDEAKKITTEYEKLKESPMYIPMERFQLIVKQFQKLPMRLPKEIEEQILKEERINKLLKEVFAKPSCDVAKQIYNEYEGCYLDIPDAQVISRAYNQVAILKTIEDASEHRRNLTYKEICKLEKQVDNFPLDLGPLRYGTVKIQIWLVQVDLIKMFKENARVVERPIPLQKVHEYLTKGYEYLDNIPNDDQKMLLAWKNSIQFLKDLVREIDSFLMKISYMEDPRKESSPFSHFIDMREKIEEVKVSVIQKQVFEQYNPSILQKRRELSPFLDTASTISQQSEDETLVKKLKTQDSFFRIERTVSEEVGCEKEKVSLATREKAVEDILELVEKLKGEDLMKDAREAVKTLEDRIFMECHWKKSYEKKTQALCITLVELQSYPLLQKKLLKLKLDYKEIERCLNNSIPQLELEEGKRLDQIKQENELVLNTSFLDENDPSLMDQTKLNNQNEKLLEKDHIPQKTKNKKSYSELERIVDSLNSQSKNKLNLLEKAKIPRDENSEKSKSSASSSVNNENQIESGKSGVESEMKENKNLPVLEGEKSNQVNHADQSRIGGESIKLIFEGEILQYTDKEKSLLSGCSLYTYANTDWIAQFPKISTKKLQFKRHFLPTFLESLQELQTNKASRFHKVLVGWVKVKTNDPDPFFFKKKRWRAVGKYCCYPDLPGIEVYLVPENSISGEFAKLKDELNWVCRDPGLPPFPEQSEQLLFAICITRDFQLADKTPNLEILKAIPC